MLLNKKQNTDKTVKVTVDSSSLFIYPYNSDGKILFLVTKVMR